MGCDQGAGLEGAVRPAGRQGSGLAVAARPGLSQEMALGSSPMVS